MEGMSRRNSNTKIQPGVHYEKKKVKNIGQSGAAVFAASPCSFPLSLHPSTASQLSLFS